MLNPKMFSLITIVKINLAMRKDKTFHNDYNPSKDKLKIGGMIVGRLF